MNIPKEAVEAGARALHALDQSCNGSHYRTVEWEDITDNARAEFIEEARAVLQAAAPFMGD